MVQGTNTLIIVQGVDRTWHARRLFNVIPDRIEAGTFLIAGAITKSDISPLSSVIPEHLATRNC